MGKIRLIYQFDPTRLVEVKKIGRFNTDVLFYNLSSGELRHPPEVSDDVSTLTNINDYKEWEFEDVLGFARTIGTLKGIKLDKLQAKKLSNTSLSSLPESLNTNWDEEIENILLSRYPGTALEFLTRTFVDEDNLIDGLAFGHGGAAPETSRYSTD